MKTNKINKCSNISLKLVFVFAGLLMINMMFSQGTHPGTDPGGMPVPIDGGILMALLAGGGLFTLLFKKKKKNN